MSEMTQEQLDDWCVMAQGKWDDMVKDSGKSQAVFVATDDRATEFLFHYANAQLQSKERGLTMPDLTGDILVTILDDEIFDNEPSVD